MFGLEKIFIAFTQVKLWRWSSKNDAEQGEAGNFLRDNGADLPGRPLRGRGWVKLLYPKNPTWR